MDHRSTRATDEDYSESTTHVKDKPKGARTWTWVCTFLEQNISAVDHFAGVATYVMGAKGFLKRLLAASLLGTWLEEGMLTPKHL